MMAERTTVFFGHSNSGFQVGQNSGSITTEIHLPPERPETPPEPSSIIPFRQDPDFVEREAILEKLRNSCWKPASRVALVGLGGVGKSQLAAEHAYRVQDIFQREHKELWTFWVHAETRARVEESFERIANRVKIPGRSQPKANILKLVYEWLQNERNGQWLMVLDSANDKDVFYDARNQAEQMATAKAERELWEYIPQSSNGSILVTTRNKELAFDLTGGHKNIIIVGPMEQEQALELLARKSGFQYDQDDGTQLVEALEYIPLAISQAAAYIQRSAPRASVKKYLDDFRKGDQEKSSLLNYNSGDLRRDGSASNSVIITWQISFEYIRLRRPSATKLLSVLRFFDRQGILDSLVRPFDDGDDGTNQNEGTDDESVVSIKALIDELNEDITTLRDYCLLHTNETGDIFEMHELVQLATRRWLDMRKETKIFKQSCIFRLNRQCPPHDFRCWDNYQRLFPHVEKAIEFCLRDKDYSGDKKLLSTWAEILRLYSWYPLQQGKYGIAELMATESWNTLSRIRGPGYHRTLSSMNNLALTYENQGRWNEAELLNMRLIDMSTAALGPGHPDTLTAMNNLASVYQDQGRWKEAEPLKKEILNKREEILGPDHPNTLESKVNLASVYFHQGRWEKAEALEEKALDGFKALLGAKHPTTLTIMSGLGASCYKQGQWGKAERLGVQALEGRKEKLGAEHPDTLTSMASLSAVYWSQKRWKEAEYLCARSLDGRKKVLGPDHPDTLTSMHNLSSTYHSQGRWEESERLRAQVLDKRITLIGPDHYETLAAMEGLASTWNCQGLVYNALQLLEDCYQKRIRVLGPEHPDTRKTLSTLQDWRTQERQARRALKAKNWTARIFYQLIVVVMVIIYAGLYNGGPTDASDALSVTE
ncbi:P-loop containing nucleoside triphosphate hydrolase protein [Nemania sp. FL0916]|nr:P-loop containing nucleoside triphosphate hydrolase protein [Nemania sp. FL0916]